MKFDFDDILIKPAVLTNINSRSDIDVSDLQGMLPLFTAPMDTVVNENNSDYFINNNIRTILPRKNNIDVTTYYSTSSFCWFSYGLKEFREVFLMNTPDNRGAKMYALIDIANGHMPALKIALVEAKEKYGEELVIMVGNIANPETYVELSNAGANFIRVGIGNGCFIDGTNINTINGKKRIEEVVGGDLVLTHNCNYKEVISTKRFEYTGELIKINDDITCTPDHEFYVLPKKYSDIVTDENIHTLCEWVSAMDLHNNRDYLLIETDDYEKTKYKLKKINKIEKYTDTVYVNDLSVLDDNSYTVNGVCVHNCGCLTTQQTGIGYPMASLINEIRQLSKSINKPAKIVADGGFKKYADIIKALALGADYVMLGSILNKALESAGETTNQNDEVIDQYSQLAKNYLDVNIPLYKTFRGMSTKEVQADWGKEKIKTSEGVVRKHRVEYTISGWVDNFTHYLKSAMSYTDCPQLVDFIGNVDFIQITENSFKRYNK